MTGGTFSFDYEGYGMLDEPFRKVQMWQGKIFEAEGLFAALAIEMDMTVRVVAESIVRAELIVEDTASVLECVDDIILLEQRQHTEDA